MPDDPSRKMSAYSGFGLAMGLSAELVATTGVGLGLGWLADRALHTSPAFLFVGALMGGAAGVMRLYRTWKRQTK
jgi:F0F1-type ATP synthase assembly protein I